MNTNIFSVDCASFVGNHQTTFNQNIHCRISSKDGVTFLVGKRLCNGLYELQTKFMPPITYKAEVKPSMQLWHERLGHASKETIRLMKKNSVNGLEFVDGNEFCTGCALSKVTKESFKSSKKEKAGKPGKLVYMDLCSCSPAISINGSKYVIVFKYDFSSYTHVFFMKNKSQSAYYIREYIAKVKNEIGYKPEVIRSDNAKEFTCKEVKKFLNRE